MFTFGARRSTTTTSAERVPSMCNDADVLRAWLDAGHIYLEAGQPDAVRECLESIRRMQPRSADAFELEAAWLWCEARTLGQQKLRVSTEGLN